MQMRRFDTLDRPRSTTTAAMRRSPRSRSRRRRARSVDFTDPYYRPTGRFVARRNSRCGMLPEKLEGKKIAVVAGTAHEEYAQALFTEAESRRYPTTEGAREALRRAMSTSCSATASRSRSGSTA